MAESSASSVSGALKRLSKTLALGLPVVLLRASCVILSFGIVNLAFAVWVFIYSGMGGHGHAGIVAYSAPGPCDSSLLGLFLVCQ